MSSATGRLQIRDDGRSLVALAEALPGSVIRRADARVELDRPAEPATRIAGVAPISGDRHALIRASDRRILLPDIPLSASRVLRPLRSPAEGYGPNPRRARR